MLNIKRRERRINYGDGEKNFIQKLLSSKSGRIIFACVVLFFILVFVYISTPTKKEMIRETTDNAMQCIEDNNGYKGDATDDFVHNLGYMFSEADTTTIDPEVLETYHKYNQLVAHRHLFYSTAYIQNNKHPEGTRVSVGFLGFVFSTIQYSDLILDVEPVHKGYEQKLIDATTVQEADLGTNPNVTEYHWGGDPDN
ncbi:MAG: hypothetical protein IJM70_02890 [Prevotella sp.]|nr:hypothetical protein [Prevotella sp.]